MLKETLDAIINKKLCCTRCIIYKEVTDISFSYLKTDGLIKPGASY